MNTAYVDVLKGGGSDCAVNNQFVRLPVSTNRGLLRCGRESFVDEYLADGVGEGNGGREVRQKPDHSRQTRNSVCMTLLF